MIFWFVLSRQSGVAVVNYYLVRTFILENICSCSYVAVEITKESQGGEKNPKIQKQKKQEVG